MKKPPVYAVAQLTIQDQRAMKPTSAVCPRCSPASAASSSPPTVIEGSWDRARRARCTNATSASHEDDSLADFDRRTITIDHVARTIYVAGQGPAVIVMAQTSSRGDW